MIDLPRDIKDVLVADPKIANAVVRSAQRAYIIGAAVGQTNIVFFDAAGQQIAAYDIAVKRDLNGVRAALKQTLPNADIQIEGVGDGVVLTGSAASPIEAQQAGDLAARLVGRRRQGRQLDRRARPRPGDAEGHGRRSSARTSSSSSASISAATHELRHRGRELQQLQSVHRATAARWSPATPYQGAFGSPPSVTATLRAMESAGVVRTLAEPNLTAISGESATFIAGGEFPIPAGYTCDPRHARLHHARSASRSSASR